MTNRESSKNNVLAIYAPPDKPGALALSVNEEMKDDVFKKPLPVLTKSRRKVEVLDEETYLYEIGRIIQRDFFPDLEKLKAQNEYLEAVENNDVCKLREIYTRYSIRSRLPRISTCSSPATFETPVLKRIESVESAEPVQNKGNDVTSSEKIDVLENDHSLDEFLHKHTSEDNQSFEEIVEEAELKKRAKYPWLYKEEICPALMGSSNLLAIKDKAGNVQTWGYKNKNYIMYVPDGVDLTKEEKLELINKQKEINHTGTRLAACPFSEEESKDSLMALASQGHILEGKVGIDGKEVNPNATPRVNDYDFVKTPSPMPGVNETPLMTWGQIEGTPFRLDGSDTPVRPGLPGPVFKIAEPPARERIAHRLAEEVKEKKRNSSSSAKKHTVLKSPSIMNSPFERFDCPSPATPRLLSSHLKNRVNSDVSLRSAPSPRETLSGLRTPKRKSTTPLRTPEHFSFTPTLSSTSNLNENLTDNLLNLNVSKRPKASDFFS